VRDRRAGRTQRISVATDGAQADARSVDAHARNGLFMSRPFLSAGGRFAAFTSRAPNLVRGDANGARDVFVRDLAAGTTTRVSASYAAGISGDGRVILFRSFANDLVPGDTNRRRDVFVRITCRPGAAIAVRGRAERRREDERAEAGGKGVVSRGAG
jgi:hypothetical protein